MEYHVFMTKESSKKSEEEIISLAGLSEKEAKVYMFLIEKGRLGIFDLLKKASYKRGDLYNILYSLRDRGLVEQITDLGKIHFQAKDPYVLRDLLDQKRREAQEDIMTVEAVLPKLLSMFTLTQKKPSVRTYEGLEGLQKVYDQLNSSGAKTLLLFRSVKDNDDPALNTLIGKQINKQIRLKMKTLALTPEANDSRKTYLAIDKERGVERRIIERNKFYLPAQFMIWGDTVAIISLDEDIISTLIENKAIAESFKAIFSYIWEASEENSKKIIAGWAEGS